MTELTCEHREYTAEDDTRDDDFATGAACGAPATHRRCNPVGRPVCEKHKCRCNLAIDLYDANTVPVRIPVPPEPHWETMTPREIFAALKTAPKVAGPWTHSHANMEARFEPNGKLVTFRTKTETLSAEDQAFLRRISKYPNIHTGESRAQCDARLRELGWLLVDDDGGGT